MRKLVITSVLVALSAPFAGAEEITTAPAKVSGMREPTPEDRALDEPSFVTVIELEERRGEAASVAEVLAEAVGVRVRSIGGLGGFSSISIRGATGSQTEILLDGVPMSRLVFSAVDAGGLDLGTFERLEIYRGGVPAQLGGAVLGGAVNFVTAIGPRNGRRNEVSVGGGSFGMRKVRIARHDAPWNAFLSTVQLSYAGATGDFSFFDDGGTPLRADDDRTTTRRNNGFDQLDVVGRVRGGGRTTIEAGERLSWKVQGVPGPTGAMAEHATLSTLRNVLDLQVTTRPRELYRLKLGARTWFLAERQRWEDPEGEVGVAVQDRSYTTFAAGASGDASWLLGRRQLLRADLDLRVETTEELDHLTMTTSGGDRFSLGASIGDELVLGARDELVLVPALRIDWLSTRGDGLLPDGAELDGAEARDDVFLSPRASLRWKVTPSLSVKGNLGRYFRPPTLVEMFGDRGYILGNPELRPETGVSGDVGLVVAPAGEWGAVDHLYLEAAFFASRPKDLIALLMGAGRFARAVNLGEVRISGHEVAASARLWRTATLSANYTFLDSAQRSPIISYDGKRLPGRPRHEAYLRLDVARRLEPRWSAVEFELGGWVDATLVSSNFLDAGNTDEVPPRRFLGVGLRATVPIGDDELTITASAANLLDERVEDIDLGREVRPGVDSVPRAVSDFLGYPLPGRAFQATCELTF